MVEKIIRKELLDDALNGTLSLDTLKQSLTGETDVITGSISMEGGRLFM